MPHRAELQKYLAEIGRRGGRTSRRTLTQVQARQMVAVRTARRAYREFHATCFWSFDPNYRVTKNDVAWIAEQLAKHGNCNAWQTAASLTRMVQASDET